jgi:AcrR family transcriptional regulator
MTTPLRERRRQLLRDEILDAALTLLIEKGYAALSMDDLAERAGIAKPTIYNHFKTKDEIVVATAIRNLDRFLAVIQSEPAERTPLQRLTRLLRTIIQTHASTEVLLMRSAMPEMLMLLEANALARERLQQIDSAVVAHIQDAMAHGEIEPTLDPASIACAFHALAHTSKFGHRNAVNAPDPATLADTIITLFIRAVQPAR